MDSLRCYGRHSSGGCMDGSLRAVRGQMCFLKCQHIGFMNTAARTAPHELSQVKMEFLCQTTRDGGDSDLPRFGFVHGCHCHRGGQFRRFLRF